MNRLSIRLGFPCPVEITLKSVRRKRNLREALTEVNRRSVGIDGIRWEAYVEPLAYLPSNPNVVDERWEFASERMRSQRNTGQPAIVAGYHPSHEPCNKERRGHGPEPTQGPLPDSYRIRRQG